MSSESVLTFVVSIILILYIVVMMKLKPTSENDEQADRLTKVRANKTSESSVVKNTTKQVGTRTTINKAPASASRTTVSKASAISTSPEMSGVSGTTANEQSAKKKSFLLFGEANFGGCNHSFGHLKTLPKNTPIPDECFGCPEILACMRQSEDKQKLESIVALS